MAIYKWMVTFVIGVTQYYNRILLIYKQQLMVAARFYYMVMAFCIHTTIRTMREIEKGYPYGYRF
jgi:hypothetical protein